MHKNRWTLLVMISQIAITLAGCAVPGRFSREQYAQLDADPFLSTEADTSLVASSVADRAPSMTQKRPAEPTEDRFAFVADEECSDSPECEPPSITRVAETTDRPEEEEVLASFFEMPEEADAPKQLIQTVAHAEDEFSKFMTHQKNQVVHASAEFIDTVESTQNEVRQTVEQSGFWGFPADRPVEIPDSAQLRELPENNNSFFGDDDNGIEQGNPFAESSTTPAVPPPADVFDETPDKTSWPPGHFEFN